MRAPRSWSTRSGLYPCAAGCTHTQLGASIQMFCGRQDGGHGGMGSSWHGRYHVTIEYGDWKAPGLVIWSRRLEVQSGIPLSANLWGLSVEVSSMHFHLAEVGKSPQHGTDSCLHFP